MKMLNYVKENKRYLIVMIVGLMLFAAQMKNVILYADDFILGNISKGGFKAAFDHFVMHYKTWGGGMTALFAVIFLMYKPVVWKICHCIVVYTIVALSVKMITYKKKSGKTICAILIWSFLYIMDIAIARETLYWMDGAIGYTFSLFQIFIYFYYLYTRIILNINKKYDVVLYPIVGLLSGWSSAQTAPVAVLISILFLIWHKFINKQKLLNLKKINYIAMIFSVIGCMIFMLAPGNYSRMSVSTQFAGYSFTEKILYRVDSVVELLFNFKLHPVAGIPFYFLLAVGLIAAISFIFLRKEKNKKIKCIIGVTTIIQLIFIIMSMCVSLGFYGADEITRLFFNFSNLLVVYNENAFRFLFMIPYISAFLVIMSTLISCYYICVRRKSPFLIIALVIALCTQGVMVMAPASELRTTYYTVVFLWIINAYLVLVAREEKIRIAGIFVAMLTVLNFQFGIFSVIAYIIIVGISNSLQDVDVVKMDIVLSLILVSIFAVCKYEGTYVGYKYNKEVYDENVRRIMEFKNDGNEKNEIQLLKPYDDTYSFTPMVGNEWVEEAIKQYFEIDQSVKFTSEM